jgi:hypothetical protein
LDNLAAVYGNQERHGEAEPLYRRALEINEKARGRAIIDIRGPSRYDLPRSI